MASKKSKKKPKFQTFQDTILNLQKYWSKHGCIILQPYDMEVGAIMILDLLRMIGKVQL